MFKSLMAYIITFKDRAWSPLAFLKGQSGLKPSSHEQVLFFKCMKKYDKFFLGNKPIYTSLFLNKESCQGKFVMCETCLCGMSREI